MAHRGHPTSTRSSEGEDSMTTSHQLPHAHAHAQAHAHTHTHAHAHTHAQVQAHSHSHSHAHSHTHHAHSNDHNKHRLSHDSNVALDTGLATAISSSIIENCDSPDDTSSIEGSTQSAVDTPVDGEDLQCVLKDLDEYEFAVGVAEDRNKRCRRTMEDTHAFIYNYEGITGHGFFAIFDGHAGKSAADWCGQHFHEVLGRILEERGSDQDVDVQELVNDAFLAVDEQLAVALQQGRASGCTAIMAYIRKEGNARVLYTGNVGDARAVLCHKGKAVRLSYDHKGSDTTEAQRILDVGGFVMNNRVNGVLAVTRALGDSSMKEFVIGAPYTTRTEVGPDNPYLILACDGLWDVCSDQEAVDLIKDVVCPSKASQILLDHALQKFSTDNISVMVVRLRP